MYEEELGDENNTPSLFPNSSSSPSSAPAHLPVMADLLLHHFDLTSSAAQSYSSANAYYEYGAGSMPHTAPISGAVDARMW